MSFKLIAIRPIIGITSKYVKNLEPGEVYSLCNDYSLLNREGKPVSYSDQVYTISYKQTVPESLYSIISANREVVNINVSAVVGKNGAGKSSLMDLLLMSIFIVSKKLDFVNPENFIESRSDSLKDNEMAFYNKEIKKLRSGLKVEIYYLLNDKYFRLGIDKGAFKLEACSIGEERAEFSERNISIKDYGEINNLFYTIVVNYSLYAYNSNYNGIWLKSFFHKNDGYQMPIVINPFRDKGNIDINIETLLTRSRLLSNVLSIPSYKKINSKSTIDKIELYFDFNKNYKFLLDGKPRFSSSFIEKFRTHILIPLYSKMFGDSSSYPYIDTPMKECAEIYLINKIITIPSKYESFKEFDKRYAKGKERSDNYDFKKSAAANYVKDLYEDRSHITLKVRQTLNYLHEDIYNLPSNFDLKSKFDLKSVVSKMNSLKAKDWFTELIDYLPPPVMTSRIRFVDGSYFEDLSSGEKQKIYSLNSVIYHLKNLDSINKNKYRNANKKISSYQSVNLMFDEVELYYHPQYQKETISSLLQLIRISKFQFIRNVNIIFLTHSPFILSDIPIQNTSLLTTDKKTGRSKLVKRKKQSFGANIHDLLADNFFLTGPLIGDYADSKIMKLISRIKDNRHLKEDEFLLKLIGDTFLKSSIEQYKKRNDQDSDK